MSSMDLPLVTEMKQELSRADVNKIIRRLPIKDSLAALDYMMRNLYEGIEYAGDYKDTTC